MFQIKWTKKALDEQADILKYWIRHNNSKTYSKKIAVEIKAKEFLLLDNPFIGIETDIDGIRMILIVKNFSLFYRLNNNVIEILSFWDNRRNPDHVEI